MLAILTVSPLRRMSAVTMRPSLREVTDAFIRLIACGSDSSFSMRGFHFPDGPYVEYEGHAELDEKVLEKNLSDLIEEVDS